MATLKIVAKCLVCEEGWEAEVELPAGWASGSGDGGGRVELEFQAALCPAHSEIAVWAGAQCPGCMYGFGDECGLQKTYKYSGERPRLCAGDLEMIRRGVCPVRHEGSFVLREGGTELEAVASGVIAPVGGDVFAEAIRAYTRRWFGCEPWEM